MLRYFVGTSVLVIGLLTVLTGFLFVRLADANFAERSESQSAKEAVHFASIFYDLVWAPNQLAGGQRTLQEIDPAALETCAE